MTEREVFETRLRAALSLHLANGPSDFDALGFARIVAAAEPRRYGRAAAITRLLPALPGVRRQRGAGLAPPSAWSPAFRMAAMLAVVGSLLAATAAAFYVGSELLRRTSDLTSVTLAVALTLEHPGGVAAVAWSPDGTRLGTASRAIDGQGGVAMVWDATTGDELLRFITGDRETTVATMGYSPDGTRIAIGGPANAVYDAVTGEERVRLPASFHAYSPDGSRIGVGGAWGWAAVIDAATGEELFALPLAPSWVWAMAWSPDGTRIATTWGTSIKIWDASTGDERLTIGGLVRRTDLAWSPDGTRIAGARTDGRTTKVYSATTGDELASLDRHDLGGVQALAWSPDGTRIAAAGSDGTAGVWDAATGAELAILRDHAARVTDVAWSPDGTRIATAGDDGRARIWLVTRE